MTFRSAAPSDAEAIYNIEKAVQLNPWSLKEVTAEIEMAQSLVAIEGDGQLEGYVFYRGSAAQYDLTNIAVAPSNLGKGLAKELIDQMITAIKAQAAPLNRTDSASNSDAVSVLLEVSKNNPRAIRFYEKCGFSSLSIRPRYYSDGSDAVVMTLCLSKD